MSPDIARCLLETQCPLSETATQVRARASSLNLCCPGDQGPLKGWAQCLCSKGFISLQTQAEIGRGPRIVSCSWSCHNFLGNGRKPRAFWSPWHLPFCWLRSLSGSLLLPAQFSVAPSHGGSSSMSDLSGCPGVAQRSSAYLAYTRP